jgi:uncharacterized protein YjbI with pentapeptide repeats
VVVVEVNGYTIEPFAKLVEADFDGADLEGAKLSGADLERADLSGAEADKDTTRPEGFDPYAAGAWR